LENKLIVGDDLYVTNVERLKKGIELKSSNAAIVKPNQIGTISQTAEFVKLAKKNDIKIVFSHRSGETEDNILPHLAVGFGAEYAKIGIGGERTVKINEFLRIEEIIER
jgi:enolase